MRLAQRSDSIGCSRSAQDSSLAANPPHSCPPGSALGVAWFHPQTILCTARAYLVSEAAYRHCNGLKTQVVGARF